MGHCHSRTLKEVTADLEADLLASAQRVLKGDFNQSLDSNHRNLQDTVEAIAKAEFKTKFKYDWDSTSVSPPNRDPDNKVANQLAWDYCSIASDDNDTITNAIAKYVKDGLTSTKLASWMKDKATADLVDTIGKLIVQPKDSEWHYAPASLQYDANNLNEDSFKLDLSVVYTNATKTESCVEATLHIFYFVGAYYPVKSPFAQTFAALCKKAYDAASKLTSGKSVGSDADLGNALLQWSTSAGGPFNNDFQRPWSQKPSDLVTGNSNPIYATNNSLAFFNTSQPDHAYLDRYIESNVMIGFDIPDKMKAWVKGILLSEYTNILAQTRTSGWNHTKLTGTYGWGDTSGAAVSLNGELIYWAEELPITVADKQVTVSVYYIYILGLVYELEGSPIVKDMRVGLMKHIPGVASVPADPQPKDIKDAVFTYNSSLYTTAYKESIDWYAKNNPAEKKKKHWGDIFEFDHWNPSDAEIRQQVDLRLFKHDYDGSIKNGLQPTVYEWIVKVISESCTPNFAPDANSWYNVTNNSGFPYTFTARDKTQTPCILDVEASFAFCKASITEGVHTGGTTLKHYFICVFIAVVASLDNSDDPLDV